MQEEMRFGDLVHGAINGEVSPHTRKLVLQKLAAIAPAVSEGVHAKAMLAFVGPQTFINVSAAVGIPAAIRG